MGVYEVEFPDGVYEVEFPDEKPVNDFGPQADESTVQTVIRSLEETPEAIGRLASDAHSFLNPYADGGQGGPIDTLMRVAPEQTARVVGTVGAGTAGAASLAPFGAAWGSALGPLGAAGGTALAGGVGFGLGALGFDLAADTAS